MNPFRRFIKECPVVVIVTTASVLSTLLILWPVPTIQVAGIASISTVVMAILMLMWGEIITFMKKDRQ